MVDSGYRASSFEPPLPPAKVHYLPGSPLAFPDFCTRRLRSLLYELPNLFSAKLTESSQHSKVMLLELDALVEANDWVEILDPRKNEYYYFNYSTNENTWTLPETFSQWRNSEIDKFLKRSRSPWRRYEDKKRKSYYFNKSSNITQWDPPEEVVEYVDLLGKLTKKRHKKRKQDSSQENIISPSKVAKTSLTEDKKEEAKAVSEDVAAREDEFNDFDTYDNFHEFSSEVTSQVKEAHSDFETTPTLTQVEEIYDDWETSPVRQYGALPEEAVAADISEDKEDQGKHYLASLEAQLAIPDAIMEPDIHNTLASLATAADGNADTVRKGVTALIRGYRGYAQMVGLASQWLQKALEISRKKESYGIPCDMEANAMLFSSNYIEGEVIYSRHL